MLPAEHGLGQCLIEKPLFQEEPDYPTSPELLERIAGTDRDEEEAVEAIESTLKNDCVPVGMECGELPESLMTGYHTGDQGPASGFGVILGDQGIDQLPDRGEQRAVELEEASQGLGNCPYELSMRQPEEQVIGQVLPEEDGPFMAAGGAEEEGLAGEGPE